MHGAIAGNEAVVARLVAAGAKVDFADLDGDTALILAIEQGHLGVVKQLLAAGANLTQTDNLLSLAAMSGNLALLEFLCDRGLPVNVKDESGDAALHVATLEDQGAMVQYLLARGAAVDLANAQGDTPLLIAVYQGNRAIAQSLLAHGADIHYHNGEDNVISLAYSQNHYDLIGILIAHGANPDQKLPKGKTLLMYAADQGDLSLIQQLLTAKADVNARDDFNATPLMWAAHRGFVDAVQLLLDNAPAIDINATNKRGDTALKIAQYNHCDAVVELLQAKGAFL
jgi:ankyrin repeat protein